MKSMTVVIKFSDGEKPMPISFGDKVLGGEVIALAAYDVMHTMEIAESAIQNSNDNRCISAVEKIDNYIVSKI